MFTSRAEYRLRLRADNADQRLTGKGIDAGIIGAERQRAHAERMAALQEARRRLEALEKSPNQLQAAGIKINLDGVKRSALQVLAYPDVDFEALTRVWPELADMPGAIAEQMAIEATYAGYLERQDADIRALRRDAGLALPDDLDFDAIPGLSAEIRQKLEHARPANLAAAARISGVTPAAITVLLGYLKRRDAAQGRLSA